MKKLFVVFMLLSTTVFAQDQYVKELPSIVGQETDYWKWNQRQEKHDSVVQIITPKGSGTGVIVEIIKDKKVKDGHEGLALTAWHVVKEYIHEKDKIIVSYYSKRKAKLSRVIAIDEDSDLALIHTWVPEDINAVKISNDSVSEFYNAAGLGGNSSPVCCLRHFGGFRKLKFPSNGEATYYDVPVIPGDSGSPVFSGNELVGIISGGNRWYPDRKVRDKSGELIDTTWPLRASSLASIKKLMKDRPPLVKPSSTYPPVNNIPLFEGLVIPDIFPN